PVADIFIALRADFGGSLGPVFNPARPSGVLIPKPSFPPHPTSPPRFRNRLAKISGLVFASSDRPAGQSHATCVVLRTTITSSGRVTSFTLVRAGGCHSLETGIGAACRR